MSAGLLRLQGRLAARRAAVVEAVRLGQEALDLPRAEACAAVAAELQAAEGRGMARPPRLQAWVERAVAAAEEER